MAPLSAEFEQPVDGLAFPPQTAPCRAHAPAAIAKTLLNIFGCRAMTTATLFRTSHERKEMRAQSVGEGAAFWRDPNSDYKGLARIQPARVREAGGDYPDVTVRDADDPLQPEQDHWGTSLNGGEELSSSSSYLDLVF